MENLDLLKEKVAEVLNDRTDIADGLKGLLSTNLAGIIGEGMKAKDAANEGLGALGGLTSMLGMGTPSVGNSAVASTVTKLFDSVVAPKLGLSDGIAATIRGLLPQIVDKCMAAVGK